MTLRHLPLLLVLCGFSSQAPATDTLREQELAQEMEGRAAAGEMVWLEAQGTRFSALFRDAATPETHGGIVLVHDLESAPDAPELLRPLRTRLPDHGWATLSLQAPRREAGAEANDYLPLLPETLARLDAGLDYLHGRKIDNLIMIGYRHGGLGVLHYLEGKTEANVKAAVMVNLVSSGDKDHVAQLLDAMGKVRIPLLDVLGGKTAPGGGDLIQQRQRVMKANTGYRLSLLIDTRTGLDDVADLLVNRIHGWLMRLPVPKESSPPDEATQ